MSAPDHTVVLFDEQRRLPQNAVGAVRYHRADATEEYAGVTAWRAVRTLGRGSVSRFSWDYDDSRASPFMAAGARSRQDQGQRGNRIAIDINDYRIDPPHAGDTNADHIDLTSARMAGHDYAIRYFHSEGTHALDAAAGPELTELIDQMQRLHGGSNVESGGSGGAPANIDLLGVGDTTAAAAGHILLRAVQDISLFANELGIKLIASLGMVKVQAQGDAMELLAKKVLELISTTDWINIKARKGVRLYGGGSEVEISAAGILGYTNGKNHMFAADHQTMPPQERPLQFPDELPHHEVCIPCLQKAAEGNSALAEGA